MGWRYQWQHKLVGDREEVLRSPLSYLIPAGNSDAPSLQAFLREVLLDDMLSTSLTKTVGSDVAVNGQSPVLPPAILAFIGIAPI